MVPPPAAALAPAAPPPRALGLFLDEDEAAELARLVDAGFGVPLRFRREGGAVRAGTVDFPAAPRWRGTVLDGGLAQAELALEMPPGQVLVAVVGPVPWSEPVPVQGALGRGGGALLMIQDPILGRLERRRLEAAADAPGADTPGGERRRPPRAAPVGAELESLLRLAADVSAAEGAAYFAFDPGGPRLARRVGAADLAGRAAADGETYPFDRVRRGGRPVHRPRDSRAPERYLTPVGDGGEPRGCLVVVCREGGSLTPVERRLVDGVATQLERHLGQAEGDRRQRHRLDHLERLHAIEERIHGTLDLVDVLETGLDICAQHLGGRAQGILVLGDGSHDLHLRDHTGRSRVLSRFDTAEDEAVWGRLLAASRPLRVEFDARRGARGGYYPVGSKEAVGCVLGPVHRPYGVLFTALDRPATPGDIEALQLVSLPLARALKNAILFEKGERQIAELSLINEMGKALNSSLDLDDVLHYIVDMIASILEADRGSLMLLDRATSELYIEVATGLSERGREMRLAVGEGIAGAVAAGGEAILSRNTSTDPRYLVDNPGAAAPLTLISAPITCRGKLLGVLNFERPLEGADAFHVDDLELLTTLASQAGIAIENAGLYNDLVQVYFDTIRSLASALEAKDIYTHGHSRRVAKDAVRIARRLGLGKKQLEMIRHGALLHDIGKIGIRDSILFKPGPLDTDELRHIRSHPELGATIMSSFDVLQEVRDIVRHHHERWDGAGFPDRLAGEQIPLGARIVCVADSYDAMITSRPYREGMPIPKALGILEAEKGTQFDPDIVDLFVEVVRSMHPDMAVPGRA